MGRSIKILHLEDNEDDAFLIQRFLKKKGYELSIKRVENRQDFRQALESQEWDIILSDYFLPNYSGMDAIELVSSMDIETPFILISGAITEETAVELMHKGASDYVMKDSLSRLIPAIERELYEAEFHRKSRETDIAIQSMVKSIVGTTGRECFEKILRELCEWVGVESGLIGQVHGDVIRTVACIADHARADNFDCPILGSPCGQSLKTGFSVYPENAARLFPDGKMLLDMQIESYVGIHLKSSESSIQGVLCIFSKQKINPPSRIKEYMEIVSAKIISELDRKQEEEQRRNLENKLRQAQKMESIGTLAGGIAHDFNNILVPLLGYAEMLKEDLPDDSPLKKSTNEILKAAMRAKNLVRQILTLSRQSAQEFQPLNIPLILKEAVKLLAASIPKTIQVETDIDQQCDLVVADPTQIHQIIMNLSTNAYHAMQDTGGKLKIVLEQVLIENAAGILDLENGRYVRLKVIDTGAGIKKEVMDKIFDPYFTTKKMDKGTGLGLSIVQGIVKKCNGDILVYSELGKGTRVHVYLPSIEKEKKTQPPLPVNQIPTGTERILLVDDEESIVGMEKQMLERLGYTIDAFTSSRRALEAFKAEPDRFELVITDMTMPELTGIQLANEIKAIRLELPIIICTGFSDKINANTCKDYNIQGFLTKPIIKDDISRTIRTVLDAL